MVIYFLAQSITRRNSQCLARLVIDTIQYKIQLVFITRLNKTVLLKGRVTMYLLIIVLREEISLEFRLKILIEDDLRIGSSKESHRQNSFHQSSFKLRNQFFSSIQLLLTQRIIFINPTSITQQDKRNCRRLESRDLTRWRLYEFVSSLLALSRRVIG